MRIRLNLELDLDFPAPDLDPMLNLFSPDEIMRGAADDFLTVVEDPTEQAQAALADALQQAAEQMPAGVTLEPAGGLGMNGWQGAVLSALVRGSGPGHRRLVQFEIERMTAFARAIAARVKDEESRRALRTAPLAVDGSTEPAAFVEELAAWLFVRWAEEQLGEASPEGLDDYFRSLGRIAVGTDSEVPPPKNDSVDVMRHLGLELFRLWTRVWAPAEIK